MSKENTISKGLKNAKDVLMQNEDYYIKKINENILKYNNSRTLLINTYNKIRLRLNYILNDNDFTDYIEEEQQSTADTKHINDLKEKDLTLEQKTASDAFEILKTKFQSNPEIYQKMEKKFKPIFKFGKRISKY